jgi:Uma2 family endonuclease
LLTCCFSKNWQFADEFVLEIVKSVKPLVSVVCFSRRVSLNAWMKGGERMTTIARFPTVVTADWIPGPPQGQWTYADYAAIPNDGKRYEVVEGVLYMSPAPNLGHQGIAGEIFVHLHRFVQMTGLGRVFVAPADVELSIGNVVQPDVFAVLNEHLDRMAYSRLIGAPDLVVEVLSPGTMRHDLKAKLEAYERARVSEYWIVNPGERVVELLVLENRAYRSLGAFQGDDVLPTRIVPDWSVAVEQFFAFV